mmetsp:Transcript_23273/g.55031  ORF Transcript_23273/g.55031 Transcript_23273/m.55031 type:complete len:1470 (-) Transcript_23273:218-4627(-)|eukprot:CAMPEP_0197184048 /NCGR_PEP_ID=MMETSP1423-20130617/9108_1 /TAXON_ID=476441 /ORGANISM="Pseudo-nitzschia heimii, Strain UNC1101" /LENGTH=1469 /DNA_ID=CAMNT_0042634767 /DNA_START=165 /DNA_END=4574 /DNA_ORIENTATION=+
MASVCKNKKRSPAPKSASRKVAAAKSKAHSPDSVACIDLTGSSLESSVIEFEKERRFGTTRKELEPPSARKNKKGNLKTTSTGNSKYDEIIILDSDDDDNMFISNDDSDCEIIDVEEAIASRPLKKPKLEDQGASSSSSTNKQFRDDDNYLNNEGVEIVEATVRKPTAATMVAESTATLQSGSENDEDVVVEGVLNETRLPHMRQHCTRFPFESSLQSRCIQTNSKIRKANQQSCVLCYCYVCDCPVKNCKNWYSSSSNALKHNHCLASDKNATWQKMRLAAKRKDSSLPSAGTTTNTTAGSNDRNNEEVGEDPPSGHHFIKDCPYGYDCDSCWCYICDTDIDSCTDSWSHRAACPTIERDRERRRRRKLSTFGLPGPFMPDNPDAHLDKDLIQCRHCSWFIRPVVRSSNIPSSYDWCTHCGLVASEEDLEKDQATSTNRKINPMAEPFLLGQKDVLFQIKAHDPRLFEKWKAIWVDDGHRSSEWRYDDADREEEVFLHRLGKSPKFYNIIRMLPFVTNENIPKDCETFRTNYRRVNDQKAQDATDAIVIEDEKEFEFLYRIVSLGSIWHGENPIEVNASWNKGLRSGIFKIQLVLPKACFLVQNSNPEYIPYHMLLLLGTWFDILPLHLSELCGVLRTTTSDDLISELKLNGINGIFDIPIKPYRIHRGKIRGDLHQKLSSRLDSLQNVKSLTKSKLSMAPSNRCRFYGGVSSSNPQDFFRDSIVRYIYEGFPSLLSDLSNWDDADFIASCIGAIRSDSYRYLDMILGFQTSVAAKLCFRKDAKKLIRKSSSINSSSSVIEEMMIRLENLGHESEDFVEGLNIELLDFQRQSLKWALEREQIPGGVQSFYWPKLPNRGEGQEEVYYNPLLALFRKDKPAVIRGGFIADQMGLGKTIISLSLILKNPAPEFPRSGSSISILENIDQVDNSSQKCGWDKDLPKKTSIKDKKTGSVICKGTLVICPVSLVGQWIDEARSKLKEPGLIYPYHGQNRKRNPKILAANSIVVTTYDVVASDAFHHATKAGLDYCPPLQQIRWWRIICDEGHSLRESNTNRSKAVLSLVADHKWIVSGTPMNTRYEDLKNQLKFLGFENVEKLFKGLCRNTNNNDPNINLLMYFLRPIMMRHSQGQKYRGTSTTLMSLPKKTERKEVIRFEAKEKEEFRKLEKKVQDWYIKFRSANLNEMSKHFLMISSKLTPLRIACSGGRYPITSDNLMKEDILDGNTSEAVGSNGPEKPVFSKFVFKSKFKALLAELKKIRDDEPDSKSLVFSQFSSTLDWLKLELPKHGFQFRTLSGKMSMKKRAKALSEFQNDPPTTIFLLSMRAGSVGINLTQANRVFLMEPSFNPALEAQAIGRIHRLGQKRPVEVVRLIMKNSFEERMLEFLEKKYSNSSKEKSEEASDKNDTNDPSEKKNKDTNQAKTCHGIVGNLKSDKVQLVTDEFDTLFGVKNRLLSDEDAKYVQKVEPKIKK